MHKEQNKTKPKCISLFSGGGGFDIGLTQAGFDVIFATDLEPKCKETYIHPNNFGPNAHFYVGNVEDVNKALIEEVVGAPVGQVDLIVGGPPCPPYSKSRFYRKDKPRGIDDPVGDVTLRSYLRLLEEVNPRAFLFENVHGFIYKAHQEGFNLLKKTATDLGYNITYDVVNTADYGVPQIRKRFIMVGVQGSNFTLPIPTHSETGVQQGEQTKLFGALPSWVTAGEALGDLDTDENASDKGHFAGGKHHELLKEIPPGDNYLFFTAERGHPNPKFKWRSRYWSFLLKLAPDKPSWTIQARRSNNMGPLHWRNRILRIEEVKRLQTFPDDWFLAGTIEQQWRQVGNAVPPRLAKALGEKIIAVLSTTHAIEPIHHKSTPPEEHCHDRRNETIAVI